MSNGPQTGMTEARKVEENQKTKVTVSKSGSLERGKGFRVVLKTKLSKNLAFKKLIFKNRKFFMFFWRLK